MLLMHAMIDAKLADIDREFGPIVDGRGQVQAPSVSRDDEACKVGISLMLPGRREVIASGSAVNDKHHVHLAVATSEVFQRLKKNMKKTVTNDEPILV